MCDYVQDANVVFVQNNVMGIAMNNENICDRFSDLCILKGFLYVAKWLGEGTTRNIERWHKEKKIPECKKQRIERLLKQEGM